MLTRVAAGNCDPGLIATLERAVQGERRPDLTLLLDAAPEATASRRSQRGTEDRFEREQTDFFGGCARPTWSGPRQNHSAFRSSTRPAPSLRSRMNSASSRQIPEKLTDK